MVLPRPLSPAAARPRSPGHLRRLGVVLVLAGLLLSLAQLAAADEPRGPLIDIIELDTLIDATVAGYVEDVVAQAADDGAELLLVRLDTPGALGDAGERAVTAISGSPVPVVAYVGDPGAAAAGAGLHLAFAADVLAVAPATLLGPGAPLDFGDPAPDEAALAQAEASLAELAERHGRDAAFARASVRDGEVIAAAPPGAPLELPEGAALPDGVEPADVRVVGEEALIDAGVVDLMAQSMLDVFWALDGREVTVVAPDGSAAPQVLDVDTERAEVRFNNLGLVRQVLHAVASPVLAYLLLVAGALALLFEVFQPGFGVAGVSGVVAAAFGAYGLVVLPTSWLGAALLVAGLLALAADLALAKLGVLTAAGTVAFAAGSALLFTGPPALQVPWWLIALVTVAAVAFFVLVMTAVLRAQAGQVPADAAHLVGESGTVRSMLNPEGHVFAGGALWRARAPKEAGKVRTGTPVRVVEVDDEGMLHVEVFDNEDATARGRVGEVGRTPGAG